MNEVDVAFIAFIILSTVLLANGFNHMYTFQSNLKNSMKISRRDACACKSQPKIESFIKLENINSIDNFTPDNIIPLNFDKICRQGMLFLTTLAISLAFTPANTCADNPYFYSFSSSKVKSDINSETQKSSSIIINATPILTSKSIKRPHNKISLTPPAVGDILSERFAVLRSGVTGEKINVIRVGDSLIDRLRSLESELDSMQSDIFNDSIDWEVLSIYPTILRAYSPLFTAYTDRAFPSASLIDVSLRYALRYEVGGLYNGVQDFNDAITKRSERQAQRAFARISLAYDHYFKAGDLYEKYDDYQRESNMKDGSYYGSRFDSANDVSSKLSYIAPSIEAPSLQDEVVMLIGPDKGKIGTVLWITKGGNLESTNAVVKLAAGISGHKDVKLYPYSFLAKTTPQAVQFADDFLAAYIASAVSSGIMYPIDSFKTRIQVGKPGIPSANEGGLVSLWRGVQYFILDANDAVYVACYGLLKPFMLSLPFVDPSNGIAVFCTLVLAGALGDACGSIFRVPLEITCKQVQSGTGSSLTQPLSRGIILTSWAAILCRDMPFAGLQIALFDIYKNLFSFLDEQGWSTVSQTALWGVLAGSTAALLTTPFDVLTTSVMTNTANMTNITKTSEWTKTTSAFQASFQAIITEGGEKGKGIVSALFAGAGPRLLFFAPAAAIFFSTYSVAFDVISEAREHGTLWFS